MGFYHQKLRKAMLEMTAPSDIKQRRAIMNASHATLMAMFIKACGGSNNSSVIVPTRLQIETPDGRTVLTDGAGILPEEVGGAGDTLLGTITDNKNGKGDAIYDLAGADRDNDNGFFRIAGNQLYYTGSDSGDFENTNPSAQKSWNLVILRYANQADADNQANAQRFDYIVNLQDQTEILTITPTGGEPVLSDGAGLLQENADGSPILDGGSGPIFIGRFSDSTTATGVVYRLADATNSQSENDNDSFTISLVDGDWVVWYTGTNSGDFENADKLIIEVVRSRVGSEDMIFKYGINLQDVVPQITAYAVDGISEIGHIAVGEVSSNNGRIFAMTFDVKSEGNRIAVEFASGSGGQEFEVTAKMVAQYVDNANPSPETLTGFKVISGLLSYASIEGALNGKSQVDRDTSTQQLIDDWAIWDDYLISIQNLRGGGGAPSSSGADGFFGSILTTTAGKVGVVVVQNTAETTIANFHKTDGDYSSSGDGFFNSGNGALTFAAPAFQTGANADNEYGAIIRVSDDGGTTIDDTIDLSIFVVPDIL